MEPYRSYLPHTGVLLPNTERLAAQVLSLPTGTAVGTAEINKISQIIKVAVTQGHQIRERLRHHTPTESRIAR
jgi:dTDP-4-amino-4,6-dideoxygalactose transaminase